jgi:hypothetical protein
MMRNFQHLFARVPKRARLKKLLAEAELDKAILKEALRGN